MENSLGTGFMAVFAVSGSVVLLALQVHKHLLSDFMKEIEYEIDLEKSQLKKKVRFSKGVLEKSSNDKGSYPKKNFPKLKSCHNYNHVDDEKLDSLPLNWQALYKGILESKTFKGHY